MPILIERPTPGAPTSDPYLDWIAGQLAQLVASLRALVLLDSNTRNARTTQAERAVLFAGAAVTSGAAVRLRTLVPSVLTEAYTTALVAFDGGSGAGRYRIDGMDPIAGTAATDGMPIPAGGYQLVISGQGNIQAFSVIAEGAALDMSVTLFK